MTPLFEALYSASPASQRIALSYLPIWIRKEHSGLVYGAITHPNPQRRHLGLELATRAGLIEFLPELHTACRKGIEGDRDAVARGLPYMNTLAKRSLAEACGVVPKEEPAQEPALDTATTCRPLACPCP